MALPRFDPFSPGKYGLPHMGEVIAYYREKRGWTQEDLALVCGKDKQSAAYWERQDYLADMERRIILQKLLHIPACYLGLTWLSTTPEGETGIFAQSLEEAIGVVQTSAYGLYEDLLLSVYENPKRYSTEAAYRFYKHLQELELLLPKIPEMEKEAWLDLFCRYLQQAAIIAHQQKNDVNALAFADRAVNIATDLDDNTQMTATLFRRATLHFKQGNHAKTREDIEGALEYGNELRGPVKGSSLLLSAEVNAYYSEGDEKAQAACKKQQDKAADLLHRFGNESDGTQIKYFNHYGVHHERAKTFMRFSLFHTNDQMLLLLLKDPFKRANKKILADSRDALLLAKKYQESGSTMDLLITEARYYLLSKEYEESARIAKNALCAAKKRHSQQGITAIWDLYNLLYQLAPDNLYVLNLGVNLGAFS